MRFKNLYGLVIIFSIISFLCLVIDDYVKTDKKGFDDYVKGFSENWKKHRNVITNCVKLYKMRVLVIIINSKHKFGKLVSL